jgi:membrane associated rhomboid family serine protease
MGGVSLDFATDPKPKPAPQADPRQAGILLVIAMAGVMWVSEVLDQVTSLNLDQYGIEPRETEGLVGIVAAPFLHADFGHLIGNTVPFILLGIGIAFSGVARVVASTAIIAVVGGLGVWVLAGDNTNHIGASGIVFGYAGYLIARGAFSRNLMHLLLGVVVIAIYGTTLLFGVAPQDGISWQGHLFGAVGGVVAAWLLDSRKPAAAKAAAKPSPYAGR